MANPPSDNLNDAAGKLAQAVEQLTQVVNAQEMQFLRDQSRQTAASLQTPQGKSQYDEVLKNTSQLDVWSSVLQMRRAQAQAEWMESAQGQQAMARQATARRAMQEAQNRRQRVQDTNEMQHYGKQVNQAGEQETWNALIDARKAQARANWAESPQGQQNLAHQALAQRSKQEASEREERARVEAELQQHGKRVGQASKHQTWATSVESRRAEMQAEWMESRSGQKDLAQQVEYQRSLRDAQERQKRARNAAEMKQYGEQLNQTGRHETWDAVAQARKAQAQADWSESPQGQQAMARQATARRAMQEAQERQQRARNIAEMGQLAGTVANARMAFAKMNPVLAGVSAAWETVKGWVGAGSPAHLATLSGSRDLVRAQLGRPFQPLVEEFSRSYQNAATGLERMQDRNPGFFRGATQFGQRVARNNSLVALGNAMGGEQTSSNVVRSILGTIPGLGATNAAFGAGGNAVVRSGWFNNVANNAAQAGSDVFGEARIRALDRAMANSFLGSFARWTSRTLGVGEGMIPEREDGERMVPLAEGLRMGGQADRRNRIKRSLAGLPDAGVYGGGEQFATSMQAAGANLDELQAEQLRQRILAHHRALGGDDSAAEIVQQLRDIADSTRNLRNLFPGAF